MNELWKKFFMTFNFSALSIKMAFRKIYKSKKSAKKYRRRKAKTSYPDRHNWKLDVGANVIYNSVGPTAAGTSIRLGAIDRQRPNFYQFGGNLFFSLDKVLNVSGILLTHFDRYKINAIKVRVIPECNFASVAGIGTLPTMKVCYDYDDTISPSVGDIEVRRGRTYRLDKPFTINLSPKVLNVLYNGASGQATAPVKANWINCAMPTVPHYGIKFMVRDWFCTSAPAVINDIQVRFVITYMVSVKEQIAVDRAPSLVEDIDPSGNFVDDLTQQEQPSLYNPAPRITPE